MQDYVYNFFVWWYAVKLRQLVIGLRKFEYFLIRYTNTLDMIKNLGEPLYQDYSKIGRFIGFSIRSVWVIVGGTIVILFVIPLFLVALIFALLPIIIALQIGLGFLSVLV